MEKIELVAHKREILGKKVRFLRRKGITPVNLYGRGVESIPLQIETPALRKALALAGMTSLVQLKIGTAKKIHMAIVRDFQRDPLKGDLIHVDFYQVKMDEKLKIEVPLVLIGRAPAVKDLGGILVQELNYLEIECLPADMPHKFEVDISGLIALDQAVPVKDLKVGEGITVLTDPEKSIARISRARIEVEAVVAPTAEAEAEAAEGEAAEGEEGEKKAEPAKGEGKAPAEAEKKPAAGEKKSAAGKKPA